MNSGFDIFAAASTATGDELAENGWTSTSLVNTAGTAGDFMGGGLLPTGFTQGPHHLTIPAPTDITAPNHVLTNATGDLLASPAMFGDYAGAFQAMRLAGKNTMPRFLIMEFLAAWTVASADETQSAIGFFEDNGTVSVEADQYAVIRSNGTNFLLQGNASTMATGPAISTGWHLWHIVIQWQGTTTTSGSPLVFAYQDGVAFSATGGVGIQDEFPLKIGLHSLTTNRQGLGMTHVYYSW